MFEKGTDNYKLPQWAPTDHPDFLNDMNPAYRTIDKNLGEVTEESANNSQKIVAMEALQNAQGESITQLQTIQNSHTLDIATLKHDMNDAQSNIAKNAGDIQVLEADNHEIHQDIAGHLSDYNVLLNWAKNRCITSGVFIATINSETFDFSYYKYGRNVWMNVNINKNINIPNNSAIIVDMPFVNVATDHIESEKSVLYVTADGIVVIGRIESDSSNNLIVRVSYNNEAASIDFSVNTWIFFTHNSPEYDALDDAIKALTPSVISRNPYRDVLEDDKGQTKNGGESNVTETAGTSEDNAVDNG